ncbi:ATP-binding protein, partial [Vibrio alfacsensis]
SRSLWDRTIRIKNEKHKATYFGAKDEKLIAIKRTVFLPDISDGVTIIIGQDEDRIDDTLNLLTGQLWLILGVLSIGILTLVVVQVSWSLRPLGKMQKELKLLKTGEQQTLDEQYPKEIAPLV